MILKSCELLYYNPSYPACGFTPAANIASSARAGSEHLIESRFPSNQGRRFFFLPTPTLLDSKQWQTHRNKAGQTVRPQTIALIRRCLCKGSLPRALNRRVPRCSGELSQREGDRAKISSSFKYLPSPIDGVLLALLVGQ